MNAAHTAAVARLPAAVRHAVGCRGSGSLLAVSLVACMVLVLGMVVPVAGALRAKRHAAGAADAAALAAADTVTGRVGGVACDRADEAASLMAVTVRDCTVTEAVVTVTVATRYLIFDVEARARAGPPGSS